MKNNKYLKSFTLIELIVVIAIIGLLASIVLVSTSQAIKKAKLAAVLNFSAQVYHALGAYAVGIWDFDEGTGDGQTADGAQDKSGNGNNGTTPNLGNEPTYQCEKDDTPSGQGCSLYFDGNNDYVSVPDSANLEGFTAATWELWVKIGSVISEPDMPLSKFQSYRFVLEGWTFRFAYATNNQPWADPFDSGISYSDYIEKWVHLIVTYDSGASDPKMKWFIDGANVASKSGVEGAINKPESNSPLIIGADWNLLLGAYRFFNGLIDDVRIYEEALTHAQIKKLYVEGAKERGLLTEK